MRDNGWGVLRLHGRSAVTSPQLENGYTRIANELLDALCAIDVNGTQASILLALIRETYGFGRKSAELGTTRLANMTGRHRTRVALELQRLIARGIVLEVSPASFGTCRRLSLNKDYTAWAGVLSTNPLTVNESATVNESVVETVNESVDETVNESVDHIKKPIKETFKETSSCVPHESKGKQSRRAVIFDPVDMANAQRLKTVVDLYDPAYYADTQPDMNRWADVFRLIRTADGRSQADIDEILAGLPHDDFWPQNVRAPKALRGILKDGRDRFKAILASIRRNTNGHQQRHHTNGTANTSKRNYVPTAESIIETAERVSGRLGLR